MVVCDLGCVEITTTFTRLFLKHACKMYKYSTVYIRTCACEERKVHVILLCHVRIHM